MSSCISDDNTNIDGGYHCPLWLCENILHDFTYATYSTWPIHTDFAVGPTLTTYALYAVVRSYERIFTFAVLAKELLRGQASPNQSQGRFPVMELAW